MSMYDDDNMNGFDDGEGAPEESNNRTFLLIAGGMGLVVLIALVCLVGYIFLGRTSNQDVNATAQAQATSQQATIVVGLTQNSENLALTQAVAATPSFTPTTTPVVAQATITVTETANPATATVGAAFTQIAVSTQTIIPTSTALPKTGFAEDVGLPGMLAFALGLIAVIFLVRRLRAAPTR